MELGGHRDHDDLACLEDTTIEIIDPVDGRDDSPSIRPIWAMILSYLPERVAWSYPIVKGL